MESLARLGIDFWSFFLYLLNFGIIVFLVGKFLTKPVLKMIRERRETIEGNLEAAERLKKELVEQREKMEKENERLKTEVEEQMRKLHAQIDARRKQAESEIEARKVKMLEEIQKVMDKEKAELQATVRSEVVALVEKMVLSIVHNKVPKEVIAESTKDAWEMYKR